MGNSLTNSNDYEVEEDESKEKTDTKKSEIKEESKPNRTKGTDYTYDVSDMLRFTTRTIKYGPDSELRITKEDLPVPGAFLVHNLLTADECKQFIELAESMTFEPSPLRNLDTTNSNKATLDDRTQSIRNSERVLFDVTDAIGITMNNRLLPYLPQVVNCEKCDWLVQSKGPINKRWRFNRYASEQYFKPHYDAGYVYNKNEKTLFTFILYLSDGFDGGETIFFPGGRVNYHTPKDPSLECKVKPKMGTALIFFQTGELSPLHEGVPHHSPGQFKYILRSDLAYCRVKPLE